MKATPAELSAWAGTSPIPLADLDTCFGGRYWTLRASETTGENKLTLMKIATPDLKTHNRRCILPVTEIIRERMAPTGEKQLIVFCPSSKMIFGLAAVFQSGPDDSGAQLTVVHTTPNVLLTGFFASQPVVIQPCDIGRWLNPRLSWIEVQGLIRPLSAVELKYWAALPASAHPSCPPLL